MQKHPVNFLLGASILKLSLVFTDFWVKKWQIIQPNLFVMKLLEKLFFCNLKEQIYYQNYNLKKLELTDQNMIILWADVQLYYLQGLGVGC